MLVHTHGQPKNPKRIVVLGAAGFVGKTICKKLTEQKIDFLALGRKECDLENSLAFEFLKKTFQHEDVLIIISAKAPVKNTEMLLQNIRMMKNVCDALKSQPVSHVVYISSDAVYADSDGFIAEQSSAEPGSLHGVMHLTREVMLKNEWNGPLAILRPTLIYGSGDPHNGYGPNRFARLAKQNSEIVLFGEGEERRDHVFVEDVAELAIRMAKHRSRGILNAVTGRVLSFKQIAELIVKNLNSKSIITSSLRNGPMPHNGYRPFDASQTQKAFSDFVYKSFEEGMLDLRNI
jgi:UDP-glucose 4-epimerase